MTFKNITVAIAPQLMPIETACHSHPWSEKLLTSCIGGHYFGEYLTSANEIITGFYIGQYIAGEATLMDICVSPSQQGQGFGKELLGEFISTAKNKGANKLLLEVRASNISAQMLYINQGFSDVARRTGYYPSAKGFGYEDAIVMTKAI